MAKLEYVALALISLLAVGLYNYDVKSTNTHQGAFEEWMHEHARHYHSDEEKTYRMGVWVKNLEEVMKHNERYQAGEETYEMGMNHFADLLNDEFAAVYMGAKPELSAEVNNCKQQVRTFEQIPDSVDWRTKGAVTPVKNQGQCGSCWAFSATGSMEGAYYINQGKLLSFSEQQLVDCSRDYGNMGCQGGIMEFAFSYAEDHGMTTESNYPYKGVNGKCQDIKGDTHKVSACYDVHTKDTNALLEAIAHGPVSVAIQANQLGFQLYKRGVFSGNCGHKLDHGVLAVGYGEDSGKKYIIVKNSWGGAWGESGYIRLVQKEGDGQCGINDQPSYAEFNE